MFFSTTISYVSQKFHRWAETPACLQLRSDGGILILYFRIPVWLLVADTLLTKNYQSPWNTRLKLDSGENSTITLRTQTQSCIQSWYKLVVVSDAVNGKWVLPFALDYIKMVLPSMLLQKLKSAEQILLLAVYTELQSTMWWVRC